MASLPPFIINGWRLQQGEEGRARAAKQLKDFTTSSLAETFMTFQLEKHFTTPNRSVSAPSLAIIAVGKVLETLENSGDVAADVKTIAESLSSITLRQLLNDPRTPYQLLRTFLTLPQTLVAKNRRIVDVDEAVLRNEHYMRSRDSNRDGRYLVALEDLSKILANPSQNPGTLSFTRKEAPKGGLEILDELRRRELTIQPDSASFCKVFERITHGVLRGLDWSNVLVAGGMALTTLLHTDLSKDDDRAVRDPDIDLYIYGLGPEDANRKVEEVHDAWVRNLPATVHAKLVVKNAKTINLLSSYPHRRIQIVLKLLPSPTDVLLNFDLDACAIGFDGSRVLMLPRCARAIETGYSVFTMDLVWGHHLGDRRASQENRIFKYADRGFGLRILPSYGRSLEEDNLKAAVFKNAQSPASTDNMSEDEDDEAWSQGTWRWYQRDRKPYGRSEPGLKTMKRIAYLGQDFVHRFYFGATPLAISQERYDRQRDLGDPNKAGAEHIINQDREAKWLEVFRQTDIDNTIRGEANDRRRALDEPLEGPLMSLADLDSHEMHRGLPDGRRGLGNFEIFMRHCEAWRLHARGEATLDILDSQTSMAYDPETYDDIPTYVWDEDFRIDDFERTIESYNNGLWANVRKAICGKLGIPTRINGYRDYSTRRIRRQVCGPDLATVQEKQITIPVIVPWALEDYLLSTLPQQYEDIPSHFTDFKPLIPIHDATKYDPSTAILLSLQDTASESGNFRYWVITNESMWAQQHRVLDEIAELMWSLFHWFNQVSGTDGVMGATRMRTDNSACRWHLARSFRRRIVLPEVSDHSSVTMKSGLPSLRETLLFRPWAFASPIMPDRTFADEDGEGFHDLFKDERVLYPFPDDLFWHASDEGTWDEEAIPSWTDPSAGLMAVD
ncbi:MAG: hypothetical protein ALECFALPRED_008485 [Alectoria fallacina]|uniref:Uncharacterized protein n=1 Tax=Alectoria fallacina TaxID=1903189 RepID=A0A8H3J3W4_9LECA|nr:MAG: hypothetical protein ALECFALPRED_008485 [Alectoria fallacina]